MRSLFLFLSLLTMPFSALANHIPNTKETPIPFPGPPTTSYDSKEKPVWGTMLAIDFAMKTVRALRRGLPPEGLLLTKTGEQDGWALYSLPTGLNPGKVFQVAVNFTAENVHYFFRVDGLSLRQPSAFVPMIQGNKPTSTRFFQIDIQPPPVSCTGTPQSELDAAYLKGLGALGVRCTP